MVQPPRFQRIPEFTLPEIKNAKQELDNHKQVTQQEVSLLVSDEKTGGVNRQKILKAKKLAKVEPWLRFKD